MTRREPDAATGERYQQASAARRAKNRARGQGRQHPRVRARPIYADRSCKITRRCVGRMLLLAPGENPQELANFIGYCLAHAANRYGIQVHASVWMSNHHHTDVSDPDANIVPFKQLLHSMSPGARLSRHDSFWSGDDACETPSVDRRRLAR